MALITARGHSPETIKKGISVFVKYGFLPHEPNYLGVYPVNHPLTKHQLDCKQTGKTVSELKEIAIKHAFERSISLYGDKPHRFGMSDDDPENIATITSAMKELKIKKPHISFFVIETAKGKFIKKELDILTHRSTSSKEVQLELNPE